MNLYNLQNIVQICTYNKRRNHWYNLYRKKGWNWWKMFGVIPLFKYYTKEDLYSMILDNDLIEKDILYNHPECYIENNNVYYKPHICIYFVGDDMTRYSGASFKKFFETEKEMNDYVNKIVEECNNKNIQIKSIEAL